MQQWVEVKERLEWLGVHDSAFPSFLFPYLLIIIKIVYCNLLTTLIITFKERKTNKENLVML